MTTGQVPIRGVRIAVYAAETGTVLLAAAAFILSFTALRDLAERSGIESGLSWLWPLIVDGIIIVATISVFALAGTRVVWYPWLLLILGSGVSVAANAIHAIVAAAPDVPDVLAAAVASVPPVVLVASTHLTAILIRHSRTVLTRTPEVPVADDAHEPNAPRTDPARAESDDLGVAGPVKSDAPAPAPTLSQAPAPAPAAEEEDARLLLVHRLRAEKLNNAQIARVLGVHRSTVGRMVTPKPTDPDPVDDHPTQPDTDPAEDDPTVDPGTEPAGAGSASNEQESPS